MSRKPKTISSTLSRQRQRARDGHVVARKQPVSTVHASPLVTTQLTMMEEAIGGREALVAALLHAPAARDVAYVLGMVGDPANDQLPLATICAQAGITPGELVAAYKLGEINRAGTLATQKVGAQLADVAADTMRRALPHDIRCLECEGTKIVEGKPCPTCHGRGVHPQEGDLEHKKLALDMGKMLSSKGGGVNVNVQQNTATLVGAAGGALEKFQEATDRILYGGGAAGPAAITDGEVVPEDAGDTRGGSEIPVIDTDWQGLPL